MVPLRFHYTQTNKYQCFPGLTPTPDCHFTKSIPSPMWVSVLYPWHNPRLTRPLSRLSTSDLLFGLASASGLMALEAVLLAPPYARLLAGAGRPGAKAGAVGLQLRTERVSELLSADSLAAMLVLQQACLVAARVRSGEGRSGSCLGAGWVVLHLRYWYGAGDGAGLRVREVDGEFASSDRATL